MPTFSETFLQHFCQKLFQSNGVRKEYSKSKVGRFLRHSVYSSLFTSRVGLEETTRHINKQKRKGNLTKLRLTKVQNTFHHCKYLDAFFYLRSYKRVLFIPLDLHHTKLRGSGSSGAGAPSPGLPTPRKYATMVVQNAEEMADHRRGFTSTSRVAGEKQQAASKTVSPPGEKRETTCTTTTTTAFERHSTDVSTASNVNAAVAAAAAAALSHQRMLMSPLPFDRVSVIIVAL